VLKNDDLQENTAITNKSSNYDSLYNNNNNNNNNNENNRKCDDIFQNNEN